MSNNDLPASTTEFDLIVVGLGNAGMSAAITGHDLGARVLVIEKMPLDKAGGNSRVAGQVWFNPHDVPLAKTHLRSLAGELPIPEPVIDTWATEMSRNTEWITARLREVEGEVHRDVRDPYGQGSDITTISYGEEQGFQLGRKLDSPFEFPELEGNECGTDYHYIGPGQGYSRLWYSLNAAFNKRNIPTLYQTAAQALMIDEYGGVTGVVVHSSEGARDFHAIRGVVLATGGFANSPELAQAFLGLPHTTPMGSPANTGDGLKMAQKVGAGLAHMHNYMPIPGIRIPGSATGEILQPAGKSFITVRPDGKRFIDETLDLKHGKSTVGGVLAFNPSGPTYTIFDEKARLAGPLARSVARYPGGWTKQIDRYEWSADNTEEIEKGWIETAMSAAELADKLGIDAEGLTQQLEEYNAGAARGDADYLGRPVGAREPLDTLPLYGYRWDNLVIFTNGGLRKDGYGRVLDWYDTPIPGLYCAGEVASTYSHAMSGGGMIGDALVFGRVAARHAVSGR